MKRFLLFLTAVLLLTAGLTVSVSAAAYTAGDLNGDGTVDVRDAALLLQSSVFPELYPIGYEGSLDLDSDGTVNIRDAVRLLQYSMYPEEYPLPKPASAGLRFIPNGDGTCTVSGIGTCKDTEIVIPERSPDGDTVTQIAGNAFYRQSRITSVVIPDTVTVIGENAFGSCSALTSVTIPGSVEEIGADAFRSCFLLEVRITDLRAWCAVSLQNENSNPFSLMTALIVNGQMVTELRIPDGVTEIADYAFRGAPLTSVVFPDSVTVIGDSAFAGCSSLDSVVFSGGVREIGRSAFVSESSLSSVCITDLAAWCGISFADRNANPMSRGADLYVNGERVTCLTIPDGVTAVSGYAFSCCGSVTSVIIPESVREIGESAFQNCSRLVSVSIPEGVTAIGSSAFGYCSALTSVSLPGSVTDVGDSVFYSCRSLRNAELSAGMTRISEWMFGFCDSLISVVIPENVREIGYSAFCGCTALTSAPLPESVREIGDYAFRGAALTSVSIPDGVSRIGEYVFYGCNFSSVDIPGSVAAIGNSAFRFCDRLTSVSIPGSVESIGDYSFAGTGLCSVTIPDGVKTIGSYAFSGSSLRSVTIPDSAESIGSYAFAETELRSVTIPGSVKTIDSNAFLSCKMLSSVFVSEGVRLIGTEVFGNCTSLEDVTLPCSLYAIGRNTFSGCTALRSVVYAGTEEQWSAVRCVIGTDSASGAYLITDDLHFPTDPFSVICIGNSLRITAQPVNVMTPCGTTAAFTVTAEGYGLTYQWSSFMPGTDTWTDSALPTAAAPTLEIRAEKALDGCLYRCTVRDSKGNTVVSDAAMLSVGSTGLQYASAGDGTCAVSGIGTCTDTEIVIPEKSPAGDTVTAVGANAFYRCEALTAVTIPEGVVIIDNSAFEFCGALQTVTLPSTLKRIGSRAFWYCGSLENVTLPDGLTTIFNDAFAVCTSMTEVSIPAGLTAVIGNAWQSCSHITAFHVSDGNTRFSERDGVLFNADQTVLIAYPIGKAGDSYTVPDGVLELGDHAFRSCTCSTITLPESLTTLDAYAFMDCTNIKEISLPSSVTTIRHDVFRFCDALEALTFPENVTEIEDNMFSWCTALTRITLPAGVNTIGSRIFFQCPNQIEICFDGTEAQWNAIRFHENWDGDSAGCTVSFREEAPAGSQGLEYESCGDGTCMLCGLGTCTDSEIIIPEKSPAGDDVLFINESVFSYQTGITSVVIPCGIDSIPAYEFYGCDSLERVTLPASLTGIGEWAFAFCTELTEIVFEGTEDEWANVGKESDWDTCINSYTVICSDSN